MQDQEVISEFLVESYENLSRLDQELISLEKPTKNAALLASIFRIIHTIKGTCGFLAFSTLERITHRAQLSQLRDGEPELTPALISLILETVDATRKVLACIEKSGEEGPLRFDELTERLRTAVQSAGRHRQPPRLGFDVWSPGGTCGRQMLPGGCRGNWGQVRLSPKVHRGRVDIRTMSRGLH